MILHLPAVCSFALHARISGIQLRACSSSATGRLHYPALSPRPSHLPMMAAPPIPQLSQLSSLQPALVPIVSVIGLCILGMVPSGLRVIFSTSSRRQLHRRVLTGCTLGALVSLWIFSGTWAFLSIFALYAVVAQNEYYAMARENGCYPTWKLGLIGSLGMYVAACSTNPVLRDALFPLTGTVTIVYLLLRSAVERRTPETSMNDISTTFVIATALASLPRQLSRRARARLHTPSDVPVLTPASALSQMGIYYFGYMPSFWIRLRCLGPLTPSTLLPAVLPAASPVWSWPIIKGLLASSADFFTWGAIVQWWTMFAIVTADGPRAALRTQPPTLCTRAERDGVDMHSGGLLFGQELWPHATHIGEPKQDVGGPHWRLPWRDGHVCLGRSPHALAAPAPTRRHLRLDVRRHGTDR